MSVQYFTVLALCVHSLLDVHTRMSEAFHRRHPWLDRTHTSLLCITPSLSVKNFGEHTRASIYDLSITAEIKFVSH